MWQEVIVGTCVVLAIAFLMRQYIPGLRARHNGGCAGCQQGCQNKKSSGGCGSP